MNCPFLLGFQQSDADLHHMRICSVVSWLCTAKLFSHLINISLIKIPLLLLIKALAFAQAQTYLGKYFQLGFQQPPWSAGWSSIPHAPDYLYGPQLYRCLSRQNISADPASSPAKVTASSSLCLQLFSCLCCCLELVPTVAAATCDVMSSGCDVKWRYFQMRLGVQSILVHPSLCLVKGSFILVPLPG